MEMLIRSICLARAGVDTLELSTDGELLDAILRFADLRRQRSRLANWSGKPGRGNNAPHLSTRMAVSA